MARVDSFRQFDGYFRAVEILLTGEIGAWTLGHVCNDGVELLRRNACARYVNALSVGPQHDEADDGGYYKGRDGDREEAPNIGWNPNALVRRVMMMGHVLSMAGAPRRTLEERRCAGMCFRRCQADA